MCFFIDEFHNKFAFYLAVYFLFKLLLQHCDFVNLLLYFVLEFFIILSEIYVQLPVRIASFALEKRSVNFLQKEERVKLLLRRFLSAERVEIILFLILLIFPVDYFVLILSML